MNDAVCIRYSLFGIQYSVELFVWRSKPMTERERGLDEVSRAIERGDGEGGKPVRSN